MYFASFVFVGVFVVVNLFIAVVLNNLETAKRELQLGEDRQSPHHALLEAIEDLRERLERLERLLREKADPGQPALSGPGPAAAVEHGCGPARPRPPLRPGGRRGGQLSLSRRVARARSATV